MVAKIAISLCFVAAAAAVAIPGHPGAPLARLAYDDQESYPAQYEYSYSVQDERSGDVKQQKENRNGDAVHGSYSFVQPDGTLRIVEYTADKEHGFNAVVRYEGQPHSHLPTPAKVAYAAGPAVHAPAAAKVAYAATPAPFAKLSYAALAPAAFRAPAQLSYQAPTQLVYQQGPAQLAYQHSSPVAYAVRPVPKYAHTAPSANAAYAALGQVAYASPAVSYSH